MISASDCLEWLRKCEEGGLAVGLMSDGERGAFVILAPCAFLAE